MIFDFLELLFEREVEVERITHLLFGRELHEKEIKEGDEAIPAVAELSDAVRVLVVDGSLAVPLHQIIQTESFTLFLAQSAHEPHDEIFSCVSRIRLLLIMECR